jgi:outer membrane beta-barrel protein
VDFHITPRWSLGARYYDYGNSLTPEGQRVFDEARAAYNAGGQSYAIPDIDYPQRSMMGTLSWYPIYGKTNLLDWGIAQFDMYLIGGYGQIQLSSGWTNLAMGGTGVAFWLTKHLSARGEIRYQTYHDQIITGPRDIGTVNMSLGLGILL